MHDSPSRFTLVAVVVVVAAALSACANGVDRAPPVCGERGPPDSGLAVDDDDDDAGVGSEGEGDVASEGEGDVAAEGEGEGDVAGIDVATGIQPIALTGSLQNPCWSPDGTRLALTRFRNGYNEGPADVAIFDVVTGAVSVITTTDADNVNLPGSCWSAATNRIAFTSDAEDRDEVWTIAPDGSGAERITHRPGAAAFEPSFSPDGASIVFESNPVDGFGASIWKVDGDGVAAPLTDGSDDDHQPNWSPDGALIVFQSSRAGGDSPRLFTMRPDGGGVHQVTFADGTDASFSPDGAQIVFSSDDGLDLAELFAIPADGGNPSPLTDTAAAYEGAPSWSPDGRFVAYETCAGPPDGSAGTRIGIIALSTP